MSRITILALVGAVLMCGGCLEQGVSVDRHTFKSTPHLPTTITLVDTTTKEEFWKFDIPVCMRLRMDFDRSPEIEWMANNKNPASKLNWWLLPLDDEKAVDKGICYFSGCRPFLMKVTYRQGPETADGDGGRITRPCPKCPDTGGAGEMAAAPARSAPVQTAAATPEPVYHSEAAQSVISNSNAVTAAASNQSYSQASSQPQPSATASAEVIEQPDARVLMGYRR